MIWNVASAWDEISLRKWSAWWYCAFAHLQREHWLKKRILLAAMLLFHSCAFTHSINQGWANLFNRRVIFRNQKHQRAAKPVWSVNTKNGKERKFYINWCTVIVSFKCLYNFADPENLDSTLLKLCKWILPSIHFSRLHDGLILRTLSQRKKITAICWPTHGNGLYTGILNSGYLLFGTCRQKLSVQWQWLKFCLSKIFLHFGQFYFYRRQVCNKRLAIWTAITETLTLNGFTRNAKHGLTLGNSQIWNFSCSLTVYFGILPFCDLQLPPREKHSFSFWHWENERMLSTICVLKNFNYLLGT